MSHAHEGYDADLLLINSGQAKLIDLVKRNVSIPQVILELTTKLSEIEERPSLHETIEINSHARETMIKIYFHSREFYKMSELLRSHDPTPDDFHSIYESILKYAQGEGDDQVLNSLSVKYIASIMKTNLRSLLLPSFALYEWSEDPDRAPDLLVIETYINSLRPPKAVSWDPVKGPIEIQSFQDQFGFNRVFVAYDIQQDKFFITITGTDKWKVMLSTDIQFCAVTVEFFDYKEKTPIDVSVYGGIQKMFNSFKDGLCKFVKKRKTKQTSFFIGGHSLGAALSQLLVLELLKICCSNIIGATFACPRIFHSKNGLTGLIDPKRAHILNINNVRDLVSADWFGYASIGKTILFKNTNYYYNFYANHIQAFDWLKSVEFHEHYFVRE